MYGPSELPFRVGTSAIGPHGTSGNGRGKGGKGDGKGKVNVSSYYGEGKGGKCGDWMRTLSNEGSPQKLFLQWRTPSARS